MASTGYGVTTPAFGAGSGQGIVRTFTGQSHRSNHQQDREKANIDLDEEHPISKADDWAMMPDIKRYQNQNNKSHFKGRKLGVTWRNLTVKGIGANAAVQENAFSQFNIPQKVRDGRRGPPTKTILEDCSGCVKPGEMLLVLGRPGAGCTTLLKMLSNRRSGYAEVHGDIHFGTMDHKQAKRYAGQIVMNTEEELFFPTLTVGQTIDFATRMKVPFHLPEGTADASTFQQHRAEFLMKSMGISHTCGTKVGNEFVRGVSGGERKRVSIIECLATRGSVFCWDNSTRGLDASTALEYTRAIRALTDILGIATIVTLYQAGNGIYNLFDKVLVLDEGKQIYYGPMQEALPYMEELGFVCDDAANVADFLTGVTVPTERHVKEGYNNRFPRTAHEIRAHYLKSPIKAEMEKEYNYPETDIAKANTQDFQEAVQYDKHKSLPKNSALTTSFVSQVRACVIRQYQIIWGDKSTLIIKQSSTLVQALIAGSLFYMAPANSSGLFLKGGALFFSLLYNTLLAMFEVTDSFTGRPVLAKHKGLALYSPSAWNIAQIAADLPFLIFQVSIFSIILYFMVGLKVSAAAFFTYWIVVFSTTMCMTAFFRAIGAAFSSFDAASKVSGFGMVAMFTYTGYMIPKTSIHPWFVWIYWIDPLAYAFQSLMDNEFHGQIIPCVNNNLIPNGPTYNNIAHQACSGVGGAGRGQTLVTGDQYLGSLAYSHSHLWRNLGIVWAWFAFYVGITVFCTSRWKASSGSGGHLLIPREKIKQNRLLLGKDEESQTPEKSASSLPTSDSETAVEASLIRNTSVFTWKNLSYTVSTPSGDRVLLDNVQGWVK